MDRMRRNLNGAALVSAVGSVVSLGARATPTVGTTKEPTADGWMHAYLQAVAQGKTPEKAVFGAFKLQRFSGGMYALLTPIRWAPSGNQKGKPVEAPALFVCDLTSVPRPFWSLFPRDGNYAFAAVLHDYLYWIQDRDRPEADQVFRNAMDDLEIKDWQAAILYKAVDLAGQSAWKNNEDLKRSGERRILKNLPSDPTTKWVDWKMNPSAF